MKWEDTIIGQQELVEGGYLKHMAPRAGARCQCPECHEGMQRFERDSAIASERLWRMEANRMPRYSPEEIETAKGNLEAHFGIVRPSKTHPQA